MKFQRRIIPCITAALTFAALDLNKFQLAISPALLLRNVRLVAIIRRPVLAVTTAKLALLAAELLSTCCTDQFRLSVVCFEAVAVDPSS